MAFNLLNEVKGAGKLATDRFNNRERAVIAESNGPKRVISVTYNFTNQGGAVGDIELKDDQGNSVAVPAYACITRVFTDGITAFTSGGSATVAIAAGSSVLLAATAYNNAALVGFDAQSITPVKITAASTLKITVATAALTAGKMRFFVEYLQSENS